MIARLWRLVRAPSAELAAIAKEAPTTRTLLLTVAAPLAFVAAAAPALGRIVLGESARGIVYRPPIVETLIGIVVMTGLIVATLYLLGLIVARAAPMFDGADDRTRALQYSVYGASPALIALAPLILPPLWPLAFVGLYALIVLHRGAGVLMKVPPNRATAFVTLYVVAALVLLMLAAALSSCVSGFS